MRLLTHSGFFLCFSIASLSVGQADEPGTLLFSDDFERSESQEQKDEIGNGWGSNSRKRAQGNKQVDLRNGAMYISIHETADHAVSVTHPAEFTNGTVRLKFMLEDEADSLGLNFADLKYKKVWAGHLFVARISTKDVQLQDLKTGNMDLEIRKQRQAKTLTNAQKEMLKTKVVRKKHVLSTGKWHELQIDIIDRKISLQIDGKAVSQFSSDGIAHPTKRLLRLSVPRNAVVDEVRVYRKGKLSAK